MNNNEDLLKIELRAVPVAEHSWKLEYRVSPDQDITYEVDHNWLFGLIHFKTKRKYLVMWEEVKYIYYHSHSYLYDINNPNHIRMTVMLKNKEEFDKYKESCHTIGDLKKAISDIERASLETYWKKRRTYLEHKANILY